MYYHSLHAPNLPVSLVPTRFFIMMKNARRCQTCLNNKKVNCPEMRCGNCCRKNGCNVHKRPINQPEDTTAAKLRRYNAIKRCGALGGVGAAAAAAKAAAKIKKLNAKLTIWCLHPDCAQSVVPLYSNADLEAHTTVWHHGVAPVA